MGEGAGRRAAHQSDEARRAGQHHQRPQGATVGPGLAGEPLGDAGDGDEGHHSGQGGDGLEDDGERQPPANGLGERAQRRRGDASARVARSGGRGGRVRAGLGRL